MLLKTGLQVGNGSIKSGHVKDWPLYGLTFTVDAIHNDYHIYCNRTIDNYTSVPPLVINEDKIWQY